MRRHCGSDRIVEGLCQKPLTNFLCSHGKIGGEPATRAAISWECNGDDGEPRGTEYAAVRTNRYKLVDNATGEIELYDLQNDPYELVNLHGDPAYAEAEAALTTRLAALRSCAGRSCRTEPALETRLPRSTRRHGRRCIPAGGFVLGVRSRAQSRLIGVDFTVDGRDAGSDGAEPFDHHIEGRLLRREPRPLIEANAELVDGRILTLHERPRIC